MLRRPPLQSAPRAATPHTSRQPFRRHIRRRTRRRTQGTWTWSEQLMDRSPIEVILSDRVLSCHIRALPSDNVDFVVWMSLPQDSRACVTCGVHRLARAIRRQSSNWRRYGPCGWLAIGPWTAGIVPVGDGRAHPGLEPRGCWEQRQAVDVGMTRS